MPSSRLPTLFVLAAALSLASCASASSLVGDRRPVPAEELQSADVLAAAEEVLLEVERSSSRKVQPQLLGLTRVLAASKQVVAGVRWELEVSLSPTVCRRNTDPRIDSAAELRERCKQNDQWARVFEATALHRAWVKEAPWTVTVKRFRDAGSGEWKPYKRTADTVPDAERERLAAEDREAAAEQEAADRRREAIAARMRERLASEGEDEDAE